MSERADDGGPAFPQPIDRRGGTPWECGLGGISIRDYFAARVMQELSPDITDGITAEEAAALAYTAADAMLTERKKPQEPPAPEGSSA